MYVRLENTIREKVRICTKAEDIYNTHYIQGNLHYMDKSYYHGNWVIFKTLQMLSHVRWDYEKNISLLGIHRYYTEAQIQYTYFQYANLLAFKVKRWDTCMHIHMCVCLYQQILNVEVEQVVWYKLLV